jgi:hypothetical protein
MQQSCLFLAGQRGSGSTYPYYRTAVAYTQHLVERHAAMTVPFAAAIPAPSLQLKLGSKLTNADVGWA